MKSIKLLVALVAVLVLAAPAYTQVNTLSKTALTAAVNDTATNWAVTSTSGMVAPTTGQNGSILVVDQETALVASIISSTQVVVKRIQRPTAHGSGARIWFGAPGLFYATNPAGACTLASTYVAPWINTQTGEKFVCNATGTNTAAAQWASADPKGVTITETRAATGTQRAVVGEFITNSSMTSGNLVGTRGAVTVPSGATVAGSYLYGAQGKVIVTGTISGTSIAGVYGQLDVTSGTLSGGNNAAVQANIYGANSGPWTNLDGIYVEHAGGGVINSLIKVFGKSTYVFDLASNTHTQMGTTGAATTAAGWLKLNVEGVTRYINLWSTAP